MALAVAACSPPPPDDVSGASSEQGVRGGTLRVANVAPLDSLDPGEAYTTPAWALMRLFARTLYSWDSGAEGDERLKPVPDLATETSISDDRRTYSFMLRRGVRWAPPVDREVVADDFVYAVERQLRSEEPPLNRYIWLIEGAEEYASGEAGAVRGIQSVGRYRLRITLNRPAADFLSILALPFFAPVPKDHASNYTLGEEYSAYVVGSGPYTLADYRPREMITFVRNVNWDPATDPLRKAWVDQVEVKVYDPGGGGTESSPAESARLVQQGLERLEADLNGDAAGPPVEDLERLAADESLRTQLGVETTGCIRYLVFQTDTGPTADVRVRQAVNYAIDKADLVTVLGGRYGGEAASTVLPPSMSGYEQYDLYPSEGNRGDVDAAKELLRQAGHPNGVTLNYVGESTGAGPAVTESLEQSLGRAGIRLDVRAYPGYDRYTKSLRLDSRANEHHVGYARWCPDWPGDGARSFFETLLDGRRITPTNNNNYGNYNNETLNILIDMALNEPEREQRDAIWARADKLVMEDAAWAPLIYERQAYFRSSRVKNWRFGTWVSQPDYANLWLDPYNP